MTELEHPSTSPISQAAYTYISQNGWTIVAVGLNKKPLGEWGPGGRNRYDYTNLEHVYQLNAPGIGVITGPSGLVIIDLDNVDAIKLWADQFGVPMTRVAKTPRGRHLYYQAPPGIHVPPGTEILPGVDVRGGESYAILPPSTLANGAYEWAQDSIIQPLPDDVLNLVLETKPKRKQKILSGEPFDEGSRNDHLFSMACQMRAGGFDYSAILAAIKETNKTRCSPLVDLDEIESIVESAISYEAGQIHGVDLITHLRAQAAILDDDDAPILTTHTRRLHTPSLVNDEPAPIDWIWEDFIAPGTLNMLHGEGGLGKSFIALKIAEQLVDHKPEPVFGKNINPGGVIILDGENAESQIHRRIHYTSIPADANLNVYIATDVILGLEEQTEAYFDHLDQTHHPKLVIIDSQRALWAGDEKEQAEAGRMLRRFARYVEQKTFGVLMIHHDNRGGDYSGSSDINAAITGCRIHIKRHTDKDKPNARILTQPKNRIAPEMPRQEFLLEIGDNGLAKPRSHRHDVSGINLTPYVSDTDTQRAQWLRQAITLALNTSEGVSYRDLWVALGWEIKPDNKGVGTAHEGDWAALKEALSERGFACKVNGQHGGRVYKDDAE